MEIPKKNRAIVDWTMYLFPEAAGLMLGAIIDDKKLATIDRERVEITINDEKGFLYSQCTRGGTLHAFWSVRIDVLETLLQVCDKSLTFEIGCKKISELKKQYDAVINQIITY